ncbi:TetR/AcrR family transcriptional regulator [Antrihabitans cavernicola]|uniref:TetR/AcrR family transcriptional regulator n=1 Tax=Antrihabitans cavernicola TaxID=2495913 RepID=A0A5A7SDG6_9NOCA|nr:TetR/AcrR family transcriptional regulator [Spelaeibacter cavernicola]KAA0022535.1 TetR/AcrR family transcriptional regulator [Spelaeibacter cavernicola]
MDIVKRIRLNPLERRDQLIELGMTMLSLRGLEQISVEDIAKKAGISRGLLFHYFASKRDFHLAIVQHASDELLERTAPDPSLTEPAEILRDAMRRYLEYVEDNRESYISFMRGPASTDPEMRAIFDSNRAEIARRTIAHLPIPPHVSAARTDLAVRGWIAFIEEATVSWLKDPQITRDELIDMNVQALPTLTLSPGLAAALLD